ncbi:STAS domain-containing protein [Sporosarcina sp. 179-K 8C2 HS]|uniref:STAS domain-containing protein n=1 Tax=Sporosarcina sp. 179-K 8C2 HS TaxID=3142387 RepID=UPI0039A2B0B3
MFCFLLTMIKEHVEVEFEGDLDIDGTEVVIDELIPSLESFSSVKLNLKDVPFVDSSGIGLLLDLVKTMQEKGAEVTISNVRQEVMEVFELLQIQEIIGEEIFV